jgi:hypothetical protein
LKNRIDEWVYYYVVRTVELDNETGKEEFVQKGCGPNWEGRRITLCTCKLSMCANMESKDWEGFWIAGIGGVKAERGNRCLVYLMKVKKAYDSHCDIYRAARKEPHVIPLRAREKKRTDKNPLGDIYVPRANRQLKGEARFNPENYLKPINTKHYAHPHLKDDEWRSDIERKPRWNRHPSLLIGDPHFSFLWSTPTLRLTKEEKTFTQGNKKMPLSVSFCLD